VAGPHARDVLQTLTDTDLSTASFRFLDFRSVDLGTIPARVGRISYTGDLGYELWVLPHYQRVLFDRLMHAGAQYEIRLFGARALMSLRLEKSYGTWMREYRPIYTPLEAGIGSYLKLDHEFVGRAAHEAEALVGPARRLVTFAVEPDPDQPADVIGDEPIWHDGAVVGWVTSGGYAHHSRVSLALGYVPAGLSPDAAPGAFEIEIIGRRRPATLQLRPVFDPDGRRLRQ
jgi:dimethylglycine dehydrogenase